jgi:hypothetical protein
MSKMSFDTKKQIASHKTDKEEFEFLMAKNEINVPADRWDGALAAYSELKKMASLLRQPREVESEPANVFNLHALLRGQ